IWWRTSSTSRCRKSAISSTDEPNARQYLSSARSIAGQGLSHRVLMDHPVAVPTTEGCERSAVFLRRTLELQGRGNTGTWLRSHGQFIRPLRCTEAEAGAPLGCRYSSGSLITAG